MKLYLDTCSLHRPVDDRAQIRVSLEAEAILAALALCEAGSASLVSSDALTLEVGRNSHPQRRAYVAGVLGKATINVAVDTAVEARARELEAGGFKTLDALHLACAEAAGVDYFCTCDDRLLKKSRNMTDLHMKVVSPLELVQEIVP